jgi:hypothetical protein
VAAQQSVVARAAAMDRKRAEATKSAATLTANQLQLLNL